MPAPSAPRPSAVLASADSAPKLMSETKTGISSRSGLAAAGPDGHRRVHRLAVQHREAVQLRCQHLQVVPRGQLRTGHAHGGDAAVRAGEAVAGQVVDLRDERLLDGVLVRVVEQPVVGRGGRALGAHAAGTRPGRPCRRAPHRPARGRRTCRSARPGCRPTRRCRAGSPSRAHRRSGWRPRPARRPGAHRGAGTAPRRRARLHRGARARDRSRRPPHGRVRPRRDRRVGRPACMCCPFTLPLALAGSGHRTGRTEPRERAGVT